MKAYPELFTLTVREKKKIFCHDGGVLCAGSVCESCQNAEKYGRCAGSGIGCVLRFTFFLENIFSKLHISSRSELDMFVNR